MADPQNTDDLRAMLDQRACEALITRYTHLVDFGPGVEVADLFTDDGVWSSGQETYEGRDAIAKFFGRERGHTKSRHVSSNTAVTPTGADTADGLSYFTLYRYTEEKPRVPDLDDQPVILGEYRDSFVRTSEGWRIVRRDAEVGFVRRSALKG
ncbi:MAG: nuclear transport factor 2 family protein [Acidimicrobiales bacterium]